MTIMIYLAYNLELTSNTLFPENDRHKMLSRLELENNVTDFPTHFNGIQTGFWVMLIS